MHNCFTHISTRGENHGHCGSFLARHWKSFLDFDVSRFQVGTRLTLRAQHCAYCWVSCPVGLGRSLEPASLEGSLVSLPLRIQGSLFEHPCVNSLESGVQLAPADTKLWRVDSCLTQLQRFAKSLQPPSYHRCAPADIRTSSPYRLGITRSVSYSWPHWTACPFPVSAGDGAETPWSSGTC